MTKVHVYNRGTRSRPNYWVRYSVHGEAQREPCGSPGSPCRVRREADEFARELERQIRHGEWRPPADRVPTLFANYAPKVIARRAARGVKTAAKDESAHVHKHLLHVFGGIDLRSLTFPVIRDGFQLIASKADERTGRTPSGKTVANIHGTLRVILTEAAEDGILTALPPPLTAKRGHLPAPVDRDPEWRATAVFDRDEVATLLRCNAIETQYRVMYATWFLTGSRFSEIIPLTLRDFDRTRKPLAALTLPAAKTRRDRNPMYRVVPVHPDLRAWLSWWVDREWEVWHGHKPGPDDLLFPTLGKIRRNAGERLCSHGEIYKRWQRHHLPAAGLRHRRLHDARRTFISVSRSSGASRELVRSITHKVSGDKVIDAYTSWEWDALCGEIAKLDWRLPAPPGRTAQVVELKRARR